MRRLFDWLRINRINRGQTPIDPTAEAPHRRINGGLTPIDSIDSIAGAPDGALNSATRVTVEELIALQRHAGKISLAPAQAARAPLAGNHGSRFHGRGMDYQESRVYQAGDDVRSIDWRVTARTGRTHTKLYEEERERPVILFVDLNPGMFFGTRGSLKSVAAARAAALLGWAAAAHGDRVGALLFNGEHCELTPRGGRHGVLRLIRELVGRTDPHLALLHAEPGPGGLNAALARLRRISRPGSLIFLLSDFYGIDDETGRHLLRLRHQSDLAAIQVVDPLELATPPAAPYGVTDGSATGVLDTRDAAVRQAYQDYFSHHHARIADMMKSRAIPLSRLATGEDVTATLARHFAPAGRTRANARAAA